MSKLAVFFPGIGYTVDKPLLYYSRKIAGSLGYELKLMTYSGFPPKIMGDRDKMLESYRIALEQSKEMLAGTDFSLYDDVLFVSKSIGTVVAAELAAAAGRNVRHVFYTPLEETFSFDTGRAIAFTGSADPWVGAEKSRIPKLCADRGISCMRIAGANHSLETGNLELDLENLQIIMEKTRAFIAKTEN